MLVPPETSANRRSTTARSAACRAFCRRALRPRRGPVTEEVSTVGSTFQSHAEHQEANRGSGARGAEHEGHRPSAGAADTVIMGEIMPYVNVSVARPDHAMTSSSASAHADDPLGLDDEDHPHLVAASVPGIGRPEVLLGERVDVLRRTVGGDLED